MDQNPYVFEQRRSEVQNAEMVEEGCEKRQRHSNRVLDGRSVKEEANRPHREMQVFLFYLRDKRKIMQYALVPVLNV